MASNEERLMDEAGKDEPIYEEAPAAPHYDSVKAASLGRSAMVRSSTKGKTRRKSTLKNEKTRKRAGSNRAAPAAASRDFAPGTTVLQVLELMKEKWQEDSKFVLRCLMEMERTVETDEEKAEQLANVEGGVEFIMKVMKELSDEMTGNVRSTSCWVLSNLARTDTSAQRLVKCGAVDYVLQIMDNEAHEEQLQHACLALLCNVALHEKLRSELCRKGTLATVTNALSRFPNHEWIQYTALQTLQNFANTYSLCFELMEHDTVAPLLKAMYHFDDHDELLQSCNWIISCMAFSGDNVRRAILQQQFNVAKYIVQSMKDSPEHLGVQFTGCSALSNLARNVEIHDSLVREGIIGVVTDALRRHQNHEGIQMAGCRCYVVLAPNKTARQRVKAAQGLALCEQVLDIYPNSGAATEAAEAIRLFREGDGGGCCLLL